MHDSAVLRTLVVTDLVDSTHLVELLGDERAAKFWAWHDAGARLLLKRHDGQEIDKSDGFLLLFERPIDAVRFALDWHARLGEAGAELGSVLGGHRVATRVGVHLGEIHVRENSSDTVQRGARRLEVEGLAKPITARVMALALGGQTLLTRGAFDLARRAAAGSDSVPPGARWIAHGQYVLKGVEEPVEVFEVGVEGSAPLIPPPDGEKARRALRPGEEDLLGWRPAPGIAVPGREHWMLESRLGAGGFGEVWLARHAKTRDPRVFKFCFDPERLRGLKREVTLFRLIRESLGDRPDIARVIDWSFDGPPFYIESEYSEGGDFEAWADARGGLGGVPLEVRLELLAQVAEALDAAHSVGVLHKDIKPSNILVVDGEGGPRAKLTDFGIGLVKERRLLEERGITASGLTMADESSGTSSRSGTRMYMAPELIEGRPASTKADVYSLGVMLYQAVIGDFRRSLGVGWERDLADDMLRRDVADCVDGDPALRLATAGELAVRLRSLPERRRAAAEAREREKLAAEEKRRTEALSQSLRMAKIASPFLLAVIVMLAFLYTRSERALEREAEARGQVATALASEQEQRGRATRRAELARAQYREIEKLVFAVMVELGSKLDPYSRRDADVLEFTARRVADFGLNVAVDESDSEAVLQHLQWLMASSRTVGQSGSLTESVSLARRAEEVAARHHDLGGDTHYLARLVLAMALKQGADAVAAERILAGLWEERALLDTLPPERAIAIKSGLAMHLCGSGGMNAHGVALAREILAGPRIASDLPWLSPCPAAEAALALRAARQYLPVSEREDGLTERYLAEIQSCDAETSETLAEYWAMKSLDAFDRSDTAGAEEAAARSIALKESIHGPDSAMLLSDLSNLYSILNFGGRYAEALAVARRRLGIAETIMDQSPESYTAALTEYASATAKLDENSDEATRIFRGAIAKSRGRLTDTAFSQLLNNAGWHFSRVGLLADAEEVLRECLAIRRAAWGPISRTAITMDNLGDCLARQGKYGEAEALYIEAEGILRKDADRPDWVAYPLNLRSNLYSQMGRKEEAEVLARESLEIRLKVLGENHPDVAMQYASHAATLRELGRLDDALAAQERSITLSQALRLPAETLAVRIAAKGGMLLKLGRNEEARASIEEACGLSRGAVDQVLKPDSPLRKFMPAPTQ